MVIEVMGLWERGALHTITGLLKRSLEAELQGGAHSQIRFRLDICDSKGSKRNLYTTQRVLSKSEEWNLLWDIWKSQICRMGSWRYSWYPLTANFQSEAQGFNCWSWCLYIICFLWNLFPLVAIQIDKDDSRSYCKAVRGLLSGGRESHLTRWSGSELYGTFVWHKLNPWQSVNHGNVSESEDEKGVFQEPGTLTERSRWDGRSS